MHDFDKKGAAHELGVSRQTLERTLKPDYYYGNKAMYTRESLEKARAGRIRRKPCNTPQHPQKIEDGERGAVDG